MSEASVQCNLYNCVADTQEHHRHVLRIAEGVGIALAEHEHEVSEYQDDEAKDEAETALADSIEHDCENRRENDENDVRN